MKRQDRDGDPAYPEIENSSLPKNICACCTHMDSFQTSLKNITEPMYPKINHVPTHIYIPLHLETKNRNFFELGCSSVTNHLPSICNALGSIHSTTEKRKRQRKEKKNIFTCKTKLDFNAFLSMITETLCHFLCL